ncbi:hypothetical protein [Bergeyella sp. RCAD1439]|uniref:hypothetical protein n=1 Tax=Bergeyella anatis TaxID=3113737 RepID=UPI002E18A681|nr:hypothetical protein [Bergeyella sp. RCAD1439]
MKKWFVFLGVILVCGVFRSQKVLPLAALPLTESSEVYADDYLNTYLYEKQNFSFTKYDVSGKVVGRQMFTVPFAVRSVTNPLKVVLFSQSAQEIRFLDAYLNEVQRLSVGRFGFISTVYTEDLQQVWLLDDSEKRLIQYNFREDRVINSFPFFIGYHDLRDFLVYEGKVYVLTEDFLRGYTFSAEKICEIQIDGATRLVRKGAAIFVVSDSGLFRLDSNNQQAATLVKKEEGKIVDKNSSAYFVLTEGKLYLYPLEN